MEKSGLAEAFTSLKYDDTPTQLMANFKKLGNQSFANGKRNVVNNMQYYRDAINHYYEAFAWAQKIEPMNPGDLKTADTDDTTYTDEELNALKSSICANAALAHIQLKNWGHVRDESKKVGYVSPKSCIAFIYSLFAQQHAQNSCDCRPSLLMTKMSRPGIV